MISRIKDYFRRRTLFSEINEDLEDIISKSQEEITQKQDINPNISHEITKENL